MEVRLAKEAGFCFGVTRAVEIARNTAQEKNQVYSLGPLIHNPQVVEKLARAGIKETENMADIPAGSTVIVPAHGVGPEVMVKLDKLKVCVVDATCPFVRRAQNLAHYLGRRTQVVIVGDQKHPEVIGIIGYAGEQALIVEGPDQAELLDTFPEVAVLAQTTQPLSNFQSVIDVLRSKTDSVKVFNTICDATGMRQQAALELARQVGAMVVAGGKTSANTRRLAELSRESGAPTYHVETARDLKAEWFKNVEVAGLTAGASTPDWIIEEVQTRMKELGEVMVEDEKNENSNVNALETEEVKTAVPEDAVDVSGSPWETSAGTDETVQESDSTDESDAVSEEGMEGTVEVKSLSPGQIVKGVVVQVGADEVLVDVGSKSEGVVPFRELSAYEAASSQDVVSLGDEIEVTVVKVEDDEGRLILSKARADAEKAWVDLQAHLDDGSPVEGVVREVIKGGLLVDVGLRAFMPASLVEQGYVEDLNKYIGVNVKSRVIELNRARRKVILSRKSVLEEERALLKQSVLQSLEEGQTVRGIVRRLTNFGAFVDIGGVDGLLHISEMAWYRVNHPSDVLSAGDEIEVRILQLDKENEKISLSLKQVLPDPWKQVVGNYPVGSIVEAKVIRLAPFGAFVQLEPGVEGLVHISHLADHHVESTGEIVHEGEEISVKVLSVEPEEKRIRLSIREAKREAQKPKNTPPETKEENVTIGDVVGDIFENN